MSITGCSKNKEDEIQYLGHWKQVDKDKYLSIINSDSNPQVQFINYDILIGDFKKELFPAKFEKSNVFVQVGFGGDMPIIYHSDSNTLTVDGRFEYARIDEDPEIVTVRVMEEAKIKRAENKKLCKQLRAEVEEFHKLNTEQRNQARAELQASLDARKPPGCRMLILW